jgi:hypothetical protein
MQKCVDDTKIVVHCQSYAWMVSYAGIIYAIHIRSKRSVNRSLKRLEFMAATWKEVEDSHAFLLAVVYCPHGLMRIMVV